MQEQDVRMSAWPESKEGEDWQPTWQACPHCGDVRLWEAEYQYQDENGVQCQAWKLACGDCGYLKHL